MFIQNRLSGLACRAFALTALFGAATAIAGAQTSASSTPTLNLTPPVASSSSEPMFSTSAADNEVVVASNHFNFVDAMNAMQYGGRHRSGRPRYRGGNTNADGSKKYEFFGGVGLTQPVGNTYHYLTPSWGFQVGAGRNFDRHFGMDVQFDYDHFGFNKRTLDNQINLYNNIDTYFNPADAGTNPYGGLDGNSHIWSFTIDPKYTVYSGEGMGAYVVGGFGFYHKVADFFVQEVVDAYDEFGYPEEYAANATVDHYTSNAPGVNGGLGLTYKFSRFSSEALYVEARYVYMFNSQRQGVTVGNYNGTTSNYVANDFPANSNRTSYIPIKVGIRF